MPIDVSRKFVYINELDVIQYVYDTRLDAKRGWACWGCNRKFRKGGATMSWALRFNMDLAPDVVMWDTAACHDLLERNKILK